MENQYWKISSHLWFILSSEYAFVGAGKTLMWPDFNWSNRYEIIFFIKDVNAAICILELLKTAVVFSAV